MTSFGFGLEGAKIAYAHLATQRLERLRRDIKTPIRPMLDARIFEKKVAEVENALKQKLGSNRIEVDPQSGNDARIKLVSADGTKLHAGQSLTDILSALELMPRLPIV